MKILQELLEAKRTDIDLKYDISGLTDVSDLSNFDKISKKGEVNKRPGPTVMINNCISITSLKGLPLDKDWQNITLAGNTKLNNLVGLPKNIEREFYLGWNNLTDLTGIPEHVGSLTMVGENQLQQFNALPKTIKNNFYASGLRSLTSLAGISAIKQIGGYIEIQIPSLNLVTNVLGLLKIEGLTKIKLIYPYEKAAIKAKKLCEILNKYIPKGDIIDCQEELIEAGFVKQAQL